jgi:hypothetical protein
MEACRISTLCAQVFAKIGSRLQRTPLVLASHLSYKSSLDVENA